MDKAEIRYKLQDIGVISLSRETRHEDQSQSVLIETNQTSALVIGGCLWDILPKYDKELHKYNEKVGTNHHLPLFSFFLTNVRLDWWSSSRVSM